MKRFEQASFVVGFLLLCWFVHRIGPERVGRNLADLGWGIVLIFGLQAAPILLNTLSWRFMLPPGRSVALTAMVRMLVAGEAVNAVSPVALVGGELVRISLLRTRIPADAALPCVALAAMAQFCAQILFVLSGLPLAILLVRSDPVRRGLVMLSVALAVLLGGLLFLAWSPEAERRIARSIDRVSWFRAISLRVPALWRGVLVQSARALRERPGHFGLAVGSSLLAWQMGVVETFLILRFLRQPVGLSRAFGIEVLAVMIEGVLFFVPAKMGTQEGGKVLIFVAAGLDPAKGLALGLVRRIRELAWAAVGLGILGHFQRRRNPTPATAARSLDHSW